MQNYGMNKYQIQKAEDKLDFNKSYMLNNGVQVDNRIVPFAEFVTNSYTNVDRYVAETQHRTHSIDTYAKDKGLECIFFTLTLPTQWHPEKTVNDKLVFNKKFGGRKEIYLSIKNKKRKNDKYKLLNGRVKYTFNGLGFDMNIDFSNSIDKYTPRNGSKELSKLLKKFFDTRVYKSIDKEDRCYFRVTEPHKNGTPHVHMCLYVPADKKDKVVETLNHLFPAPQGKIETAVNSPVAYLMKYVLKTLDDLREEDSKTTNLTLWYLYHGISRFYTSRTFISLETYRKLNGMYTLQDLTQKYALNEVSVYVYSDTKKIALIENEYGTIYVPKPVNWSQKQDEADRLSEDGKTVQLDSGFESIYKEDIPKPISVIIDGKEFNMYDTKLKEYIQGNDLLVKIGIEPISLKAILHKNTQKPYQMNDYDLFTYFQKLDIETVNLHHYAYTKNLLIDRGYEDGERLKLTYINDLNNYFEQESKF